MSRRLLAAVAALTFTAAGSARAQDARLFDNSWFWGIHGGAALVGDATGGTSAHGAMGADWLITRHAGGLYASYDQASFSGVSSIADSSAAGGNRLVDVHNLRTVSIGAVAFPFHVDEFRPYGGLGFALSEVGSATARPDSTGAAPSATAAQNVQNARSRVAVFAMGGVQWQIQRAALYGQVEFLPGASDFLLTRRMTMLTAGVRYNFGSSIAQ